MSFSELNFIFSWWIMLFVVGIVFFPLTKLFFSAFFDKGYIFSKIIGAVFISYLIFILGILKLSVFSRLEILFVLIGFAAFNFIILLKKDRDEKKSDVKIFIFEEILFFAALFFWTNIKSFQPDIHGLEKYMDFGFINSILRADYFPPKDMWFTPFSINYYYFGHLITAVLTKLSNIPSSISYNLMLGTIFAFTFTCAFSIGGNLIKQISTKYLPAGRQGQNPRLHRFAKQCGQAKQYQMTKIQNSQGKPFGHSIFENLNLFRYSDFDIRIFIGGFLSAVLITFAGNLHAIYSFFKAYPNENPVPIWNLAFSPLTFPNSYWYPNATRFIYNTIHEFPMYSFVVSDLHGHVLDIPIVFLTIALLFSLISNTKYVPAGRQGQNPRLHRFAKQCGQAKQYQMTKIQNSQGKPFGHSIFENLNLFRYSDFDIRILLLLGFLIAVMYMTNAWDGIIYFLLTSVIFLYLFFKDSLSFSDAKIKNSFQISNFKLKIYPWLSSMIILGLSFYVFSFPFNHNFKPFVSGVGVLCAPTFLTDIGKVGPFIFEADHCQHSPWWQMVTLYGFFYFWAISFFFLILKKINPKHEAPQILSTSDIFVLILILVSTLLIIIPEFIYIKDIYPAHYRANTMFKLVYQSFIMLSIASGYIIYRLISCWKLKTCLTTGKIGNWKFPIFIGLGLIGLFLVILYPNFAINSYYGDLKTRRGLDGISYLKDLYPADYEAVLWLNNNIKNQPVILEAQGDSYTDYARVSANTGLPTVLGWTVHEWLWRGTYDIPAPRINDVTSLYETSDINLTKRLLNKYNVSLIFIGDLERQKYQRINEQKFENLGVLIYQNEETKIYKVVSN